MVFIHTNHYRTDLLQYGKNIVIHLSIPTADTGAITHYALIELKKIFIRGFMYKKAGGIIMEITGQSNIQMNLFSSPDCDKSVKLMQVIDRINDKYKHGVRVAAQGYDKSAKWHLKQNNLSQCYTTNINEILSINCR